jgi:hypothetical protein
VGEVPVLEIDVTEKKQTKQIKIYAHRGVIPETEEQCSDSDEDNIPFSQMQSRKQNITHGRD